MENIAAQINNNSQGIAEVKAAIRQNTRVLNTLIEHNKENQQSTKPIVPPAASTPDRLHCLLQSPGINEALLSCQGRTLNETVRRLIRRLMSRELAMQFSLTGPGVKRTPSKLCFKEHEVSNVIISKLYTERKLIEYSSNAY